MKQYVEPICTILLVQEEDVLTLSTGNSEKYFDWDEVVKL